MIFRVSKTASPERDSAANGRWTDGYRVSRTEVRDFGNRRWTATGVLSLLSFSAFVPVAFGQAPHTTCALESSEKAVVRHYWPSAMDTVIPANDGRCSPDATGKRQCSLFGWLYTPVPRPGLVRHPTLIYTHGSGDSPREPCAFIQFLLTRGFVVFMPFRRGTESPSGHFTNTGETAESYVARRKKHWQASHGGTVPDDVIREFKVDYTADGVAEVKAAVAFVAALPEVDATRLAIAGHSAGAMTTLFAASQPLAPKPVAAAVLSSAVLVWDSGGQVEQLLAPVAKGHRMPIQFTQTVNEGPKSDPVAPIVKQFLAAESNGTGEAAAAIFSQVAGVTSVHDAHLRFMMDEAQVRRWAPVVADFLARHGVK